MRSQRLAQHVGVLKNIMGVSPAPFIFAQLWLLCAAVRSSIDEEARTAIELGKMRRNVKRCPETKEHSRERLTHRSFVHKIFSRESSDEAQERHRSSLLGTEGAEGTEARNSFLTVSQRHGKVDGFCCARDLFQKINEFPAQSTYFLTSIGNFVDSR